MKGKRDHAEAFGETQDFEERKHWKSSYPTKSSQNTLGSSNEYQQERGELHGRSTTAGSESAKREAKEWLMAALTHLRALEERPDLAACCLSILDEDISKPAQKLRETISSKRNAIKAVDSGLQFLRQPRASKSVGLNCTDLPLLPEVRDPEMAQRAFRHKSTLTNNEVLSGNMFLDYERLEFEGDSYLHIICTRFLCDRFPGHDEGELSRMREKLVCNETLAELSLRYGFDERIQIKRAKNKATDARGAWTKILGDVFEAFVAAVIRSRPDDGFTVVEDWLHVLWNHLLPGEAPLAARKTAKEELARKVCSKGIKLTYRSTKAPLPIGGGRQRFTEGVFVTGWGLEDVLLGEGSGTGKTEAGSQAADAALLNPITTELGFTKRKFDALWKEEQEREGGPRQEVLDQLDAGWK